MNVAGRLKIQSAPRPIMTIGAGIATGIAMGVFFRGPCYGVGFGALVGALGGVGALLVLRWLWASRFRPWGCATTAIVGLAIGYAVLSPPSASAILRRYVGLRDLRGITNVREFHSYGRDPAFGVKCRVTDEALQRIVTHIGVKEDLEPRAPYLDRFYGFPVPNWWRPGGIVAPRTWTHADPDVVPWITLRYDSESKVAYLVVSWH
jgi:hypothetical protein